MTAAAAKAKSQKVPVSVSAVIQRINRKLAPEDEKVRATRPGTRAEQDLGRYYIHNLRNNSIDTYHVDIEDLGRELEVLKDWEELVEE